MSWPNVGRLGSHRSVSRDRIPSRITHVLALPRVSLFRRVQRFIYLKESEREIASHIRSYWKVRSTHESTQESGA